MVDYGYYRKKKRDSPRLPWWGIVLRILDVLALAGTVLCSIALIFAYSAKYTDPSKGAVFAFAGLVFPVLFMAEIILALYWLMRWKRYAIVAATVLLFGMGNVSLFYKMNIMERYRDEKPLKSELVVMSYNVRHFTYAHSGNGGSQAGDIAEFVKDNNVDILCIQEFNNEPGVRKTLDSVLTDLKYTCFRHYAKSEEDNGRGQGLAIYSRYPITGRGTVDADPETHRSMWADIRIKRDTVRVVNNHLQSTYVNDDDVDYLSSFRVISQVRGHRQIGQIVGKLKDNYIRRAPQARNIAEFVARSPYPVIVCGDLNDTPVSYAYRTISRGLKDTFVEKGRGASGTYNGFFNMFRIDYIFMSDGLEVSQYYPFDVVYSDHNPVAASFYFSQR